MTDEELQAAFPLAPSSAEIMRFMAKVSSDPSGCWHWTGARIKRGYGTFTVRHRSVLSHRTAVQWSQGDIAPGLVVDHLCRCVRCVNPKHLEIVTPDENSRRARKAICKYGHEMTSENTLVTHGRRQCRECNRRRQRARRAATRKIGPRKGLVLTPPDVVAIRMAVRDGESQAAVSSRFHISQSMVSRLVSGARWSGVA